MRFKQAQPKMWQSPEVEDVVENQLLTSVIHMFRHFFKNFELPFIRKGLINSAWYIKAVGLSFFHL